MLNIAQPFWRVFPLRFCTPVTRGIQLPRNVTMPGKIPMADIIWGVDLRFARGNPISSEDIFLLDLLTIFNCSLFGVLCVNPCLHRDGKTGFIVQLLQSYFYIILFVCISNNAIQFETCASEFQTCVNNCTGWAIGIQAATCNGKIKNVSWYSMSLKFEVKLLHKYITKHLHIINSGK